jgi:hypothetical protein
VRGVSVGRLCSRNFPSSVVQLFLGPYETPLHWKGTPDRRITEIKPYTKSRIVKFQCRNPCKSQCKLRNTPTRIRVAEVIESLKLEVNRHLGTLKPYTARPLALKLF